MGLMNPRREKKKSKEAEHRLTSRVAAHLKNWNWPYGSDRTIAEAVDKSLKNYEKWSKELRSREDLPADVLRFLGWLCPQLLSPEGFVRLHFIEVHRTSSWKREFRDLRRHVWTPEHFDVDGRSFAREYCGDSRLWDRLMESLKHD